MKFLDYRIAKAEICYLNTNNGTISINFFPGKFTYCVIDENRGFAIDLETYLRYPYAKANPKSITNDVKAGKLSGGMRIMSFDIDQDKLPDKLERTAKYICKMLNNGVMLPDGNFIISKEEYENEKLNEKSSEFIKSLKKTYGK